jgi:phosphatidylglycerophosphatase A
LFRLFDALKPWPINWLDKNIKGALGVMVDDVAAAIFASVVQYVLVFFILDFYPLIPNSG